MSFKEKIENLYKELNERFPIEHRKWIKFSYEKILSFFNSYKHKEFDKSTLKKADIINSICLYLNNDNVDLMVKTRFIDLFIKKLSNYSLNLDYINKNENKLLNYNTCCQDKEILIKTPLLIKKLI